MPPPWPPPRRPRPTLPSRGTICGAVVPLLVAGPGWGARQRADERLRRLRDYTRLALAPRPAPADLRKPGRIVGRGTNLSDSNFLHFSGAGGGESDSPGLRPPAPIDSGVQTAGTLRRVRAPRQLTKIKIARNEGKKWTCQFYASVAKTRDVRSRTRRSAFLASPPAGERGGGRGQGSAGSAPRKVVPLLLRLHFSCASAESGPLKRRGLDRRRWGQSGQSGMIKDEMKFWAATHAPLGRRVVRISQARGPAARPDWK